MVYWNTGDIICASIGGLLVGLAVTLQYSLNGRNNGCGGVLDAFTGKGKGGNFGWKFSYFAGMTLITMIMHLSCPDGFIQITDNYIWLFFDPNEVIGALPWYTFILSGILVGAGMRLGRGCTSGHGLNGLALLSPGSFIAICLFMVFGFIFANLAHYTGVLRLSLENIELWGEGYSEFRKWAAIALFAATLLVQVWVFVSYTNKNENISCFAIGIIFGLGLLFSGMSRITKVLGFLTFDNAWDPSLAFVMGFGVLLNLFTFRYIKKNQDKPRNVEAFIERPHVPLNMRTFVGAALFGVGWGLGGLCPGPAMLNFFVLNKAPLWIAGCCIAMVVCDYYDDKNKGRKASEEPLMS